MLALAVRYYQHKFILDIRMRSQRPRAETRGELTTPTGVRTCEPSVNQRVL